MKINSITNNMHGRSISHNAQERKRECVKERENLKQNSYDNINTSIKSNPDARVSFNGAPWLHKAANFVTDKPLVAEAIFALFITCGLRPISIMATAKDETEKDKCAYQAAKSISSGLVGLAMTAVIGSHIGDATKNAEANNAFKMPDEMAKKSHEIINNGVTTLKNIAKNLQSSGNNLELADEITKVTKDDKLNIDILTKHDENGAKKFVKKIKTVAPDVSDIVIQALKEQKVVNNYPKTAKNIADKLFQPIFMPFRAAVTIALIPVLLNTLGLKKPAANLKMEHQNIYCNLNNDLFKDKNTKLLFKPFSGVKHENKQH